MLKWALIFAVVAVIAGLLGFTGIAGAAGDIAKFLFFLFLGVVAFFLIAGVFVGRKISGGYPHLSRQRQEEHPQGGDQFLPQGDRDPVGL